MSGRSAPPDLPRVRGAKEALLRRSNRSAFLGLTVLALAIVSAVLLVTDVLFDLTLA